MSMLYLDSVPTTFLDRGHVCECVATFDDGAADIGRHVRGLLFVDYDPKTLRVKSVQRVPLCDDSDRVDREALWPESASLLDAAPGSMPRVVDR